jgi:hypothetical protein
VKQRNLFPIDDSVVADIAREADVDERTVIRRLAGLPVRGRPGRRIDRVLHARMAAVPGANALPVHGPWSRAVGPVGPAADHVPEKSATAVGASDCEQAEKGQKHGVQA